MIFTNIFNDTEVSGYSPDAHSDFYKVTDKQRDHNYWQGKIVSALQGMSNAHTTDCQIIYGGEVTDGGSGTIDISAGLAMGKDSSGNKRFVAIPALSGVSLPSGWNDDRQIWVIGQYEYSFDTPTRLHKLATTTSYHYILEDNYTGNADSDDLFVDSDPNTVSDTIVCWGSFKMNGTTFSAETGRTDSMGLSLQDTTINQYGIGVNGVTADVTYALNVNGHIKADRLYLIDRITHYDDTDTFINFENNYINVFCTNVNSLYMNQYGIGVNGAVADADAAIKVTGNIEASGGISTDGNDSVKLAWDVVDIGDWNMDSTDYVYVAHGLSDEQQVRYVDVIIREDTPGGTLHHLVRSSGPAGGSIYTIDDTYIMLDRTLSGYFDNPSFDSTSYNRGWITIGYGV